MHAVPGCVIVTVFPATVIVVVRDDVPVLAATEYPTEPFPDPLEPLVIVTQLALSVAVHAQPAVPATAIVPVVPAASGEIEVGVTVKLQVTPACVIVMAWPATVIVVVRDDVPVLAAIEYPTEPFPIRSTRW